jgi:hypothetical protein
MVPQALLKHTSSLPDVADTFPASRRSPVVQFDGAVSMANNEQVIEEL